ncbi:MAG: phosphate acyltransferase [Puniceicoccaceae bacterium]
MALIDKLTERLKRHPKRIVFPEGSDPRIIQAARLFASKRLGVPVLLGERAEIKSNAHKLGIDLENIRILEPKRSEDYEEFKTQFTGLRRFKGLSDREMEAFIADPNFYAALMLWNRRVEGIVAGATTTASSALRPLLKIIPLQTGVKTVSSLQIVDFDDIGDGREELFLTDCAVIPDPSIEQLADMAITAAAMRAHLTANRPRVAFLSYTTKSRLSRNPTVLKMKAATDLAIQKAKTLGIEADFDGEMQVDAALDPGTARLKEVKSTVAGRANILVFPDLHAGNIAAKMVHYAAGVRTYGPILTGLSMPAAEISRGSSAHDILGTAILVCCQAIDPDLLYPLAGDGGDSGE